MGKQTLDSEIPYENIEAGIEPLVRALNSVSGVKTKQSCQGHSDAVYQSYVGWVTFEIEPFTEGDYKDGYRSMNLIGNVFSNFGKSASGKLEPIREGRVGRWVQKEENKPHGITLPKTKVGAQAWVEYGGGSDFTALVYHPDNEKRFEMIEKVAERIDRDRILYGL